MRKHSAPKVKSFIIGFGHDLLIALIVVSLLNYFIVQNQRVDGNSMAPTMNHGDMVIMNKWIYHFKEPEVGDIVGFYSPKLDQQVVKRIIGVPGDIIDYKDQMLYRNNNPITDEEECVILEGGDINYPYSVPQDSYFVIGDHYNESIDSRYHYIGTIPTEYISGRITWRIWPLGTSPLLK